MSTEIRTINGVYEVKETIDKVFLSEDNGYYKGYYKVSEYGTKWVKISDYSEGFLETDYENIHTVYINKRNVISIKETI